MPTRTESPARFNAKKSVIAILGLGSAMAFSFFFGRAWEEKTSAGAPPITAGPNMATQTHTKYNASDDVSSQMTSQPLPAASRHSLKQETSDIGATHQISAVPRKAAAELLAETLGALSTDNANANGKAFINPLAGWHQQFAAETPDADWSVMAQSQAEAYFFDKSSSNIELISVRCGSSVCEVQAASTTPEDSETAANEWQSNVSAMGAESWWTTYGFSTPNSAIFSAPDGRALIVTYLTRSTSAGGK